jgi:DNA-binding MarR family transcriptional regulator
MFYLRDLPDDTTLKEFAERYENMDISAVKTCLVLLRIGSDVLTGFEAMLARHGLSQGRFLTLIVLYRTPDSPLSPSTLAELVGVTRATMTGLLDGLEKEQWLERIADPSDRRRLLIRITTAGMHILHRMLPDYYDRIGRLMTGLDATEREHLIRLLYTVNAGLPAFLAEPDARPPE